MGFREKLPPIFVNDLEPLFTGFPLYSLMDFEQVNKERRPEKISKIFSSDADDRK